MSTFPSKIGERVVPRELRFLSEIDQSYLGVGEFDHPGSSFRATVRKACMPNRPAPALLTMRFTVSFHWLLF